MNLFLVVSCLWFCASLSSRCLEEKKKAIFTFLTWCEFLWSSTVNKPESDAESRIFSKLKSHEAVCFPSYLKHYDTNRTLFTTLARYRSKLSVWLLYRITAVNAALGRQVIAFMMRITREGWKSWKWPMGPMWNGKRQWWQGACMTTENMCI